MGARTTIRFAGSTAIVFAWGLASCAAPALADDAALLAEIRKLAERIEELEQRLEPTHATEARIKALEDVQTQTALGLASDRLSDKEPELATRLKAVEAESLERRKQSAMMEALEGISVGGSLTGVIQQANPGGSADNARQSRANYRGDVTVSLPGGSIGDVEGKIFTHFRFGQGSGVELRPTFTSTPNTTAFRAAAGPSDAYAIVAQAWYQLDVPLPVGGNRQQSRQRLEITAGKMDPFVFFDQNSAADDEAVRFMNNAFVHNPLLDSGGDIGADAYGFSPGARIAFFDGEDKPDTWGASLGIFGSGPGADFTGSLGDPFIIAQLETTRRFVVGQPGTYRVYWWRNGRATDFHDTDEPHSGWGISADQRVSDGVTLFARVGSEISGRVRFDRALTLGSEIAGDYWGRGADGVGLAAGLLRTSSAYRDTTSDGTLAGYAASGAERIVELYYRLHVNKYLDVTPDLQWIQRPGGDGSAPGVFVGGFRARVGF
jgi:hypothetical protein